MNSESRQRIGIMGGTFDPIHIGHLILAECAYEQFQLDTILFLPSGNPPHKKNRRDGASDRERLDMVALAIQNNPHFILDSEEMRRSGFTYTCETLRLMKEKHPQAEYYFIIGADSLMSFETWKDPEMISRDCILLAAVRDQMETEQMEQKMKELQQKFGARIHLLRSPNVGISSTQLRDWYREGRSVRYYIPDCVIDYIRNNSVY
ncbi:MAG: nicotinate-nucleotide adenylyltransferase [Lachnospiraceae bacterium]|nr:nicotinate-nucleotide adenylyltransferase [Lachnospiraceae bacterium]